MSSAEGPPAGAADPPTTAQQPQSQATPSETLLHMQPPSSQAVEQRSPVPEQNAHVQHLQPPHVQTSQLGPVPPIQNSPSQLRRPGPPPPGWPHQMPGRESSDGQMPPPLPAGYPVPPGCWPQQIPQRYMYAQPGPDGQPAPPPPGYPPQYYLPPQHFPRPEAPPTEEHDAAPDQKAQHLSPNYSAMVMQRPPQHPGVQPSPSQAPTAVLPAHMTGQPPPQGPHPLYPPTPNAHLLKPQQKEAVDKLVGLPSEQVPIQVMPQRREFFEQLVLLNEQNGENLNAPPQVSKSSVDLHRLFIAVRRRGGFKQVCDDKSWKTLCTEANPQMTESSAAGYQLRRHYQKYLLPLECRETGADMNELIQYAEKMKKKKKEKEPQAPGSSGASNAGPSTPAQPPTPGSIRSAATPTPTPGPPTSTPQAASNVPPPVQPGPVLVQPQVSVPGIPGHPYPLNNDAPIPPYYYQQQQQQHQQQQQAQVQAQQQQMHHMAGQQPPVQHPMYPPGPWPVPPQGMPQPPGYPHPGYPMRLQPGVPPPQGYPGYPQPGPPPPQHPQSHPPPAAAPIPPGPSGEQQQQSHQAPTPSMLHQQPPSVGDQSSRSTPAPPPNAHPSRPPSQAHYQPPSTPDQRGGHDEQRPASRQPHRPHATPTSSSAPIPGPAQPPPQMVPGVSQPYYPPGYRGMPPPATTKGQFPGYPAPPESQTFAAPQMIYSHQQPPPPHMWPPNSQPAAVTSSAQHQRMFNQPASGSIDFRRPQVPPPQPVAVTTAPAFFQPAGTQQGMPSPGSAQRRQVPVPQQQQQYAQAQQQARAIQPPHTSAFPPGSLEATATGNARRKRPKIYMRELPLFSSKRLTMALRSGQELEAIWAINTLNVVLYDDLAQPFILANEPQLLSLCLDHLRATLALLYPEAFALPEAAGHLELAGPFHDDEQDLPRKPSLMEVSRARRKDSAKVEHMKPVVSKANANQKNYEDFGKVSRTGRKIYVEKDSKMPLTLQRITSCTENENSKDADVAAWPPDSANVYIGISMQGFKPEAAYIVQNILFKKLMELRRKTPTPVHPMAVAQARMLTLSKLDVWDRNSSPDCSLIPRTGPVQDRNPLLEELAERALSLSNIIRGFSFVPGNERVMYNNPSLLDLIGRLLLLRVQRDEKRRTEEKPVYGQKTEPSEKEASSEERKPVINSKPAKYVPPTRDSDDKLLLETANLLRDDAFTVLSHISVALDLYNLDSMISYAILDSLIHWAVTTNVQARDPINTNSIAPRAYVFETICKMSLLETNVDLLLATGPWERIEEFVKVVCKSITMAEELPIREFAIVILTAICQASEPVCICAALETQVIPNLVSFLEIAEHNINTIAQTESVMALRENPERIGTSFGMLRRAAQILACFAQYEVCRPHFVRHQSRLLNFTVSSYMDSRVAGMVAGILYDLQHISPELLDAKEVSVQESEKMADRFPSYKWKANDYDEDPPEPFLHVTLPPSTRPFTVEASEIAGIADAPLRRLSPHGANGAPEVNGNTKRKRVNYHADGRKMTALERELLNDSDTESATDADFTDSSPGNTEDNHASSEPAHPPPPKTASEAVKEKLRNNIMKHGVDHQNLNGAHDNDEPDSKRPKMGNGTAPSPKYNGDLHNKTPVVAKSENGAPPTQTAPPQKTSGSMAAVA